MQLCSTDFQFIYPLRIFKKDPKHIIDLYLNRKKS